eukprot:CAMPEP_0113588682 /NCGR_PEP_ID=MMETSP0015_2-20120614/35650_1 /TAXON_ID=2838 /ORGANISM="Odontella" /LENGTH=662 /DNA_ID=CAMNT_0000494581 /DNA_START=339 /DNA_END=2327 /DNA_ORIENTATION=+ /assembly_acc=CAM_ASM_000160
MAPCLLHDGEIESESQPESVDPKSPEQSRPSDLTGGNDDPAAAAAPPRKGLKVLFLSSDTGGGHRASAESLAAQFELLYPGSTYELLDVVAEHGVQPYSSLVSWYSHLSSHPAQWKLVYGVSNSRAFEMMADVHLRVMCERATRKRLLNYDPDVVVSVHPLMCNVPALACQKIEKKTGRHVPMYTVVTDLGSAHCLWFANKVDGVYVASDACADLARQRGKVPDEKMTKIGLPIRHAFAVQAGKLGDRTSDAGRERQAEVRRDLALPFTDRKTVLCMGGGEGVGSLSDIVNHLYVEFVSRGIDAQILVVCGRNERLKNDLTNRDWDAVLDSHRRIKEGGAKLIGNLAFDFSEMRQHCMPGSSATRAGVPAVSSMGCIEGGVTNRLRRILSAGALENAVTTPLPDSSGASLASSEISVEGTTQQPLTMDENDGQHRGVDGEAWKDAMAAMAEEEEGHAVDHSMQEQLVPVADEETEAAAAVENVDPGKVAVHPLGFVTQMAEYMVAADLLITKAGPGTIAEAASLSFPVLLTSFLARMEEGNVDFVVGGHFGAFRPDSHPSGVAEQAADWLLDEEEMGRLSQKAGECGAPHAARDIVLSIGDGALKWRELNAERAMERKRKEEEEKKATTGAATAGGKEGEEKQGYIMRTIRSFSSVSSSAAD